MRDGRDKTTLRRAKNLRRNLTKAEAILWREFQGGKLNDFKFRKQHPIGPFIVDFACVKQKLVIEIDGATHAEDHQIEYDQRREAYQKLKDWDVVRVTNIDVYENIEGVLMVIAEKLKS